MNDQDKNKIMYIYCALCAGFLLSFVPVAAAQIIAIPFIIFALIGSYYYRWQAREDGLLRNHMNHLIRTYWLSGFLFLLGFIGAGLYLGRKLDAMRLADTILALQKGEIDMSGDMGLMIYTTLIAFAPSTIYFTYRVISGMIYALKENPVPESQRFL